MSESANLIQKRGRVKGTLARVKTFAENIQNSNTLEEITARLEKIEEVWEEFRDIEDSLLSFPNQVSEIEEFESKYFDTKALLLRARNSRSPAQGLTHSTILPSESLGADHNQTFNEHINSAMATFLTSQQAFFDSLNQSRQNATNASASNSINLPRLQIPNFSGDFREWPSFQDLFETSVHKNEGLTGCQKLQYLKGLLKGEAAAIIRHLSITENNYNEAWDKLKARYEKKRHITTAMVKTFMDLHSVTTQPSARQLRALYDTFDEVIRGLRALGDNAEKRDPWLIFIALNKLDAESRQLWSKECSERDFSSFDEFLVFLNKRCDAIETCGDIIKRAQTTKTLHATPSTSTSSCPMCKNRHSLFQCPVFKAKTVDERKLFVINKSVCFNCLQSGHSVKACRSRYRCIHCKKAHHSLLHGAGKLQETSSESSTESSINTIPSSAINPILSTNHNQQMSAFNSYLHPQSTTSAHLSESNPASLLPTAVVNVKDIHGQSHSCRILLDSGSQISFISESCVRRLCLKRQHARLAVTGVAASKSGFTKGKVSLNLSSRFDNSKGITIEAYIMQKLTSMLPSTPFNLRDWHFVQSYPLADPFVNEPLPIDVIVGADKFFNVLQEGKLECHNSQRLAQETIFGWVLCGRYSNEVFHNVSVHSNILTDLDVTLQRFWETEELVHEETLSTKEEEVCEEYFQSTTKRNEGGRYIVSLPFRSSAPPLGYSVHNAIQRLRSIEHRFKGDSLYKDHYINFMREYQNLGHMELVPEGHVDLDNSFYLPHHAVFKMSPVPKIRVVFDGSCKSSTGISLNERLMVGATVQRDLISIILSFRKHTVAFSADIEKMYRQILMSKPDRDFQRIVWRENPSEPIQHFKLTTVTYGTASAPFLATRTLLQIALDNQSTHPQAAHVIQSDFYVDDILSGASSEDEAVRLKTELVNVLRSGGFKLTKWRSNSAALFNPENDLKGPLCISYNTDSTKILGIMWNSQEDVFSFKVSPLTEEPPTKRRILSESSRIFDPLGLLAPVIISLKILFQQLWLLKLQWDDLLPAKIAARWNEIKVNLPKLSEIKIPRCICSSSKGIELHGFSDASELAISAVIYCRVISSDGTISINLVAAKTKVAPLKQVSLPRLELNAAVLLTRLTLKVTKALMIKNTKVFSWTDSAIVLSWLSDTPRRWKTYVANRTSEILNAIPRSSWGHVPSAQNPADCATRGITPIQLIESQLWWKGPSWLIEDSATWPSASNTIEIADVNIEERKNPGIICHHELINDALSDLSMRCSTFFKLARTVSYCLRFAFNRLARRNKVPREIGFIKALELKKATNVIIRWTQHQAFATEIATLLTGKQLSSKSSLLSLHPFLDDDHILRIGGRLQNSNISFNAKHPRILPRNHTLTKLIVRDMHLKYLHPGPSLLINILRQEYWIIGVRHVVKEITHKCLSCFRQKTEATRQLMGSLPTHRVTIGRPFLRSGVDFAGPVNVCIKSGRGIKPFKAYICLFVCFSTKALHLELVSNLSADAFISTLRRFVARRGMPTDMYSDNGTNFVGANRQLLALHKEALTLLYNNSLITNFLSQNCIRWHFIPPSSPHFGGLWEAGIKSVKSHLRRVIGDTILSFEEMVTLLTQVEAILNSRPLCPLSDDIDSLNVLTPSHFLIGDLLTTIPEPDLSEAKMSRLGRWQQVQAMFQGFWKRWSRDYLTSLQQRPKWKKVQPSLKKDDLVLIREANTPPTKWNIGRITETHPGADELVRVVTVKTAKGFFKRAISKVYRLPLE